MRKAWIITGIIAILFLLMQAIRPEKNLGEMNAPEDLLQVSGVPDTLAVLFINSCYDCHSDHTRYPWYGSLAPSSWLLASHIREGKSNLNFSSWGFLDKAQKISLLERICDECSEGLMPLKSYTLLHRSTILEESETEAICSWAEQESLDILKARDQVKSD